VGSNKKALIRSNIWTFFIGGALLIYGLVMIYFKYVRDINLIGTIGLPIGGAIIVIAGISNVLTYRNRRKRALGALTSYERVSLTQLSSELKLSDKQTKDIIVDLRADGKLRASFEPETGDVLILELGLLSNLNRVMFWFWKSTVNRQWPLFLCLPLDYQSMKKSTKINKYQKITTTAPIAVLL